MWVVILLLAAANGAEKAPDIFAENYNIAKNMSALQSSSWESKKAHQASYAIDGNVDTYQHTGAGDRYPWWRVDLILSWHVKKVVILSRPGAQQSFHDVTIMVSDEDIRSLGPNRIFYPGKDSVCAENIGSIKPVADTWNTFICRPDVTGRFVSVQITSDCQRWRKDCSAPADTKEQALKNLLIMKEVEVYGSPAFYDENLSRGKPAQQSTTWGPGFDASFAVDGMIGTLQHTAGGDKFPWWRVDLLQRGIVYSVSVFARPGFEKRFHDVTIVVSDEDIRSFSQNQVFYQGDETICANNIGSEHPVGPNWTTFKCKYPLIGRYVSIQITSDCKPGRQNCNTPDDSRDVAWKNLLQMNEVQVLGSALSKNIARGKPVAQSSTYLGDLTVGATSAIDGNVNTMQHTDDGDLFPWWRVDLLESYRVTNVDIYARPGLEQRFHDVTIIVSNEDISKYPPKTIFNPGKGSICDDHIGTEKPVRSKWGIIGYYCKRDVVGRYVSIQITADCKPERKNCNMPGDEIGNNRRQILHMMEVEVSGRPADEVAGYL